MPAIDFLGSVLKGYSEAQEKDKTREFLTDRENRKITAQTLISLAQNPSTRPEAGQAMMADAIAALEGKGKPKIDLAKYGQVSYTPQEMQTMQSQAEASKAAGRTRGEAMGRVDVAQQLGIDLENLPAPMKASIAFNQPWISKMGPDGRPEPTIGEKITMATAGMTLDEQNNVVPLPDDQLPPTVLMNRELMDIRRELMEAQRDYARMRTDPESPIFKQTEQRLAQAQERLNLASKDYERKARAQQFSEGYRRWQAEFQTKKPTENMRTMGQTAEVVIEKIDQALAMAQALDARDKMGVLSSRWNDFLAGTYGSGDPDFAAFRATVNLLTTGAMRAHVGARGGQGLLAHFDKIITAKRMDFPTFAASMNAVRTFMEGYVKAGQSQGKPLEYFLKESMANPYRDQTPIGQGSPMENPALYEEPLPPGWEQ